MKKVLFLTLLGILALGMFAEVAFAQSPWGGSTTLTTRHVRNNSARAKTNLRGYNGNLVNAYEGTVTTAAQQNGVTDAASDPSTGARAYSERSGWGSAADTTVSAAASNSTVSSAAQHSQSGARNTRGGYNAAVDHTLSVQEAYQADVGSNRF